MRRPTAYTLPPTLICEVVFMTKEQLRDFRALSLEAKQIRCQLREMEARMYSIGGQQFSSTPRSGSGHARTMDDLVAAHVRLQKIYQQKLVEVEKAQAEIEAALVVLTPKERLVIRSRYFEGRSWEEVCRVVSYELAQTHRLHGSALLKLGALK